MAYLTAPEQMLERAEAVGQYPARRSVWSSPRLAAALAAPPEQVLRIVESAAARPATPIWTELSEILQIWLHRALAGQAEPEAALREAAREMEHVIERSGLRGSVESSDGSVRLDRSVGSSDVEVSEP